MARQGFPIECAIYGELGASGPRVVAELVQYVREQCGQLDGLTIWALETEVISALNKGLSKGHIELYDAGGGVDLTDSGRVYWRDIDNAWRKEL